MNEPKFQVQVDETEDTEWNDILRAHGVIPERAPSPTAQLEEALEVALQKQHDTRLEGKDLDELDELEDEEDEDFLMEYKMKRMAEMRQEAQERSQFRTVYHINKPEYGKEITEASQSSFVFVHLSLSSALQSRLLSQLMQQLAPKYGEIKFVEIPGTRAIENYPDNNCPTILVYHKGDVVKTCVTLLELGGNETRLKDVESLLVRLGALKDADSRLCINNEDEDERKLRFVKKSVYESYSDSESDY